MRAVDAAQMRAIDAAAVARDGEIALMRRAGAAIAHVIPHYAGEGAIVAFAGSGNNGGDAFAALAELPTSYERICYHDPQIDGSVARIDARERAHACGVELRPYPADDHVLASAGLLLDGLLGVNARLPLDATTAQRVRQLAAANVPILALDILTGTEPSTGALDAAQMRAVATIALGHPKRGSLLEPGRGVAGDLWCAPLGMRDADADGIGTAAHILTPREFARLLPTRASDADKRAAGAPLILAGSEQFPGAAVLAARGAARAGAGYVTVVTPQAVAPILRGHLLEQVVVGYDERDPVAAITTILGLTNRCSAIAIGPGLGLSEQTGAIVRGVILGTTLPIVADASALFHFAKHLEQFADRDVLVTPHAGEFARLSGGGTLAPSERRARLDTFVRERRIATLLKGRTTLIEGRDGALHLNPTGTAALATAGSGDILSGIIATLLAQGLTPVDAGRLGAYWHGRAGQLAARERPVGVIASDIAEVLGRASVVGPTDDELFRLN